MWKAVKYILVFFAFQIAMAVPAFLMSYFLHLDKETIIILAIGMGNLLPGIYFFRKEKLSLKTDFSVSGYGSLIALCVLTTLFMILPEAAVISALELPDNIEYMEDEMCSYLGIVIGGIIGPVVEEIVFRGAVLRSLLGWERIGGRRWIAVVISAFLFSLSHFNPAQAPGTFVAGLVFGWITIETGSLAPSIVMHIVNNMSSCVFGRMVLLGYVPEDYVLLGSQTLEYVVCAISAVLFVLCLFALRRRFQYNKERGGKGKFQYLAQSKHNDAE